MLSSISSGFRPIFKFSPPLISMNRSLKLLIVPNLVKEQEIRLGDLEESYQNFLKLRYLPFKLTHSDKRDAAKEFVRLRLEQYPNGMEAIDEEDYRDLYQHLPRDESEKIKNEISLIVLYYNIILNKSIFCPATIPFEDMKKMMFDYKNYKSRIRYLEYLFVREFDVWRKECEKEAKKQKRLICEAEAEKFETGCFNKSGDLQYGNWRNSLCSPYLSRGLQLYSLHRLRQAELFGQKLVLDCSYDETMADYETISVARQLSSIYHINRYETRHPFHLLFCGYRESSRGYRHLSKSMNVHVNNPGYCLNFRKEPYQELCAGEKLICLTPDAEEVMTEFDPEAVYIISAIVDKTRPCHSSYEKATREGIRCLRLPIQQYVTLRPQVKSVLGFVDVFRIILQLREHGDWERALRLGIKADKLADCEKRPDGASDEEINCD